MTIFFRDRKSPRLSAPTDVKLLSRDKLSAMVARDRTARALRNQIFNPSVINDPAWAVMQELFAASLNDAVLRTKELCGHLGLPQTTVLRYLEHLEKFDIVSRSDDPEDQRVTLVRLTPSALFWMEEYYGHLDSRMGGCAQQP